ncbi:MAG: L-lysine 6-aminotransferase [Desulfobulbaceae bacterium BRH_c16a]|nr:MAG: L-lysine 6-aminotransferase [Desulfobulbaceae bacterium BRH_c16a]
MVAAEEVKAIISRHLLTDGMDIIVDLEKSKGSWLVDQRNGDRYLDCFSMFASMAVGFNHDGILAMQNRLGKVAVQKPANSDAYSEPMAEFLQTFAQYAIPDYLPHAFFIEGGALAVENALKAAFDWKVKKNFDRGAKKELGSKIIHFRQAFHGRSGYTLSLTNTADPRKTEYFPKFSWPRIVNPKLTFPITEESLAAVADLEAEALASIKEHIAGDGDDIAGLIIEPIQGEGGDNHFRKEFFQALRAICDEHEILFIIDEVQTGIGLTGKFWAHEHFDIQPDLIAFGKKTQVCGILASRRLDEVADNVFTEPSRINSTFGGNLVDMVRCSAILKIIDRENLIDNACRRGRELLQGLNDLAGEYPDIMSNARGMGLMCAFDLPDGQTRNTFRKKLLAEKLLVVGCGDKSIRFRPHLIITGEEIQLVLDSIRKILKQL